MKINISFLKSNTCAFLLMRLSGGRTLRTPENKWLAQMSSALGIMYPAHCYRLGLSLRGVRGQVILLMSVGTFREACWVLSPTS